MEHRISTDELAALVAKLVDARLDELGLLNGTAPATPVAEAPTTSNEPATCGKTKGNEVCVGQPNHRGRHTFRPVVLPPPERHWEDIPHVEIETGRKTVPTALITQGAPVRVEGKQGEWRVLRIEQSVEDGRINVEVNQRGGIARTVPLAKIKWVKPKS